MDSWTLDNDDLIAPGMPEFYRRLLPVKFPRYTPAQLKIRVNELLRFFHLSAAHSYGFRFPISGELDDILHTLILQTRIYPDFCKQFKEGWQLHHQSTIPGEGEEMTRDEQLSWIASYAMNFGPFTEETLRCWIAIDFVYKSLHVPIDDFNLWCNSLLMLYKQA